MKTLPKIFDCEILKISRENVFDGVHFSKVSHNSAMWLHHRFFLEYIPKTSCLKKNVKFIKPAIFSKKTELMLDLLPVTGETFDNRTANTSNEARVDIKSKGFWVRGSRHSLIEGIWPKRQSLSQQGTPSMLRSKWKAKEMTIQWKNFPNWPWKFHSPRILNLWGVWEENVARFITDWRRRWQRNDDYVNQFSKIG